MSAFLGKIHYWLYGKIQTQEAIIEEIVALANGDAKDIEKESHKRYGLPVVGELEDEINHSNIHGWLQERITEVEQRLAFVITEIQKKQLLSTEDIDAAFKKSGTEAAVQADLKAGSPEDYFNMIFNFLLEGMPCDRVNKVLEKNDDSMIWQTTECLHQPYWDEVGGDIKDFYRFRTSWINGFLKESGSGYTYTRTDDAVNKIDKEI